MRRWTLARPRLTNLLKRVEDYRLISVTAPPGYGKSTFVASWLEYTKAPFGWYSLGQSDADPLRFLLHLIYSFQHLPHKTGQQTLHLLEQEWPTSLFTPDRPNVARRALHLFINELCDKLEQESFLVLDDFHILENQQEVADLVKELIANLPPLLHVIIISRQTLSFSTLPRWQAQQEVLAIDKAQLAFSPAETVQLFAEGYGYNISTEQATRLSTETEGWIIALQMVWQNLQANPQNSDTPPLLDKIAQDLPRNLGGLFDYLAQEVFNQQSLETQQFLLESSVLRRMTGAVCDFVRQFAPGSSETVLRQLSESGFFIIVEGDEFQRSYRYHHLFEEFLYARLRHHPTQLQQLHQRAAAYYLQSREYSEALHHYLIIQSWQAAADLIIRHLGIPWIESGQLIRLENCFNIFPPNFIAAQPTLLLFQGDYLRLTSRFNDALHAYQQALASAEEANDQIGRVKALRGRALVYLDTVQPIAGEEWLAQALQLAQTLGDKPLLSAVLRDTAENKLNLGRPWEAEKLYKQAHALLGEINAPSPSDARILLRSGRLAEAIAFLEQTSEEFEPEAARQRPGRSHREGLLVLALLYSMVGEPEKARNCAEKGIELTRDLHTPFAGAVAWQRLGHALVVGNDLEKAREAYQQGLSLADRLRVRRLKAEGLMGLTVLSGSTSDSNLNEIERLANEGLEIARQAGDEWIEGLITLGLVASLGEQEAYARLIPPAQRAFALMRDCGDYFGQTVARLWEAIANQDSVLLNQVKQQCEQYGYNFLLERPTMFGLKSPKTFDRLKALNQVVSPLPLPSNVLTAFEKPALFKVTTLGSFSVCRPDGTQLQTRDWKRDKSRQLFQLFLIRLNQELTKEQLMDWLWADSDPVAANSGFKVALNALMKVLEPERSNRIQSSYIIRNGSGSSLTYSLRFEPQDLWVDARQFEQLIGQGNQAELNDNLAAALAFYENALQLYKGDFLPGCLYEDWTVPERERLLDLFLTSAEKVARLHASLNRWEDVITTCRLILNRDKCWEEAYRLTMLALWRQGNRSAALRMYDKCNKVLDEELGVSPLPLTLQLHHQILLD